MTITDERKMAPMKVEVVESDAERVEAADYGAWTTTSLIGNENGYNLLPRDRCRRRAVIIVNSPTLNVNPNTSKPVTQTGAANTTTTLNIPQPVLSANILTFLSVSFSAATTAACTLTVTDGTTPLTWSIPTGTTVFNVPLPTTGLAFASNAAVTITVTAAGVGITSTINAGYQVNQFASGLSSAALGYCLIGSRKQVQNGQGMKMRAGNAIVMEDQQDLYVTGDGVTALDILVLNERYDPNARNTYKDDQSNT